jgi:hypothetical protein
MDSEKEFQNALNTMIRAGQAGPVVIPAMVTEVRLEDRVCDVLALGEFELYDVRLRAAIDAHPDHLLVAPALGSDVLIARVGEGQEYAVMSCSRVESLQLLVGTTEIHADATGIKIMRNGQNLGTQLQQLISQIQAITVPVTTAPGVSGAPINAAAFTPIATALNEILQ